MAPAVRSSRVLPKRFAARTDVIVATGHGEQVSRNYYVLTNYTWYSPWALWWWLVAELASWCYCSVFQIFDQPLQNKQLGITVFVHLIGKRHISSQLTRGGMRCVLCDAHVLVICNVRKKSCTDFHFCHFGIAHHSSSKVWHRQHSFTKTHLAKDALHGCVIS